MRKYSMARGRKAAAALSMATVMQFGGCDLGEFQSTSVVTLDGREVVTFLVQSAILTPIQTAVENAVDNFFDRFEDDERR